MAEEKPFIELGLTEMEAYALIQALSSELETIDSPAIQDLEQKQPFMAFAAKLYRDSMQGVKDALSQALKED